VNIARSVLGIPLPPRRVAMRAVPLDSTVRTRVLGTYDLVTPGGGKFPLRVFMKDSTVSAQGEGPGQEAFPLVYYGDSVFGTPVDRDMRLTFVPGDGGGMKLRLLQGGATMEGARRP
jgi:hypothetical protein